MGHAADAAVADGNQEVFGRYGRQAQNAVGGFGNVDIAGVKRFFPRGFPSVAYDLTVLSLRVVLGGLPSKTFSGKSTGLLENKRRVLSNGRVGRRADYGKRAAFAFADGAEGVQIFFQNRQHITLL